MIGNQFPALCKGQAGVRGQRESARANGEGGTGANGGSRCDFHAIACNDGFSRPRKNCAAELMWGIGKFQSGPLRCIEGA